VWPRRFWARIGRRLIGDEGDDDYNAARQGPRLYAYLDPRTALTTLHDGQLIFVDPWPRPSCCRRLTAKW
jgi:hypothetical protein